MENVEQNIEFYYKGNPNVKKCGVPLNFTQEQVEEYIKCANDPVYFIEHYCKVVSLDKGIVPFVLRPYQKRIIEAVHNNRFTIAMLFRQSGKSTVMASYLLWYTSFNSHKTAVLLANKQKTATEIFSRVQGMYELLPFWLKQGVSEWNKTSFKFENGSRCISSATSPSAVRGYSVNLLMLDEFAFLPNNLANEFIASVFPTLSSSEESKLVIASTPNGMNAFHKIWKEAEEGTNDFKNVRGWWNEIHDQEWADKQRRLLGEIKYQAEIECEFQGSSHTLVDGKKIAVIPFVKPKKIVDNLFIFDYPQIDHKYVMTVDTSRGKGEDFTASIVYDVTKMPFKVVATFKDNQISPVTELPTLLVMLAKRYNDAYILVENNDLGEAVGNELWYSLEYENVFWTKNGKISMSGTVGVKTTKSTKMKGCSSIKEIIENDQLIINDYRIIEELGGYVLSKRGLYSAQDESINDDLCSCLFLFGWLAEQDFFKDLTNTNTTKFLAEKFKRQLEESDVTPFGFIDDGLNDLYGRQDHLNADQIELLKM